MTQTDEPTATADLCDAHGAAARACEQTFRDYGGRKAFHGRVATVKCFEDNGKVREMLSAPGRGRVLVVDAGGSRRCGMLGDQLAQLAVDNGWSGVVMYGCIRDTAAIAAMPLGVKALGTHPRKSEKRGGGETEVALRIGGVDIRPGDRLYADGDGIVLLDAG